MQNEICEKSCYSSIVNKMKKMQPNMFKYTLEKKSRKIKCPSCGEKRFVRYVDSANGEMLADNVGRCDREINCAYHYPPKLFFKAIKRA